jgi:hypothetical protein
MRAMAARELIVFARRAAIVLSACGIAALLMAFVLVWSPGVPVLVPMNLYEQTRVLHWVLLAAALPWTAVRSAPADRGDDFVLMAAFTGVRPADVVAGKIVGMFVMLVVVILTGLPALVIAQQAAAVPLPSVFGDLLPLFGLALLVAVSSTASILIVRDSLRAWLTATTVAIVVLFAASGWASGTTGGGLLCALAGVVGAGWVCAWSNTSLRYLGCADAG